MTQLIHWKLEQPTFSQEQIMSTHNILCMEEAGDFCYQTGLEGRTIPLWALCSLPLVGRYESGLQDRLTDLAIAKEVEGVDVPVKAFERVNKLLFKGHNNRSEKKLEKLIDAGSAEEAEYIDKLFSS